MSKLLEKLRSTIAVTTVAGILFSGINVVKGNEKFYCDYLMPLAYKLPPETAHNLALFACKYKLFGSSKVDNLHLKIKFFSKTLNNPVGIAAGFDKQGEAVEGLFQLGFGFVEIGSVTPLPQFGNIKPRIFRLHADKAIINRCGFNSEGHHTVFQRLKALKQNKDFDGVLGINLGINKTSNNAISDYVQGVKTFGSIADYLVINVSSPNTPGLRNLQGRRNLEDLLVAVINERNCLENNDVPIFLKLSPDLCKNDIEDITNVIKKNKCAVDGLIISNTTIERFQLIDREIAKESGGLSGAPLHEKSTKLIAQFYEATDGKIPIVGVGGIFSGKDAFEKLEAGASFLQLYTAFVYFGPPVIERIKNELADIIEAKGFSNVTEVVGTNYKKYLHNK